jgi:hypothetical protein
VVREQDGDVLVVIVVLPTHERNVLDRQELLTYLAHQIHKPGSQRRTLLSSNDPPSATSESDRWLRSPDFPLKLILSLGALLIAGLQITQPLFPADVAGRLQFDSVTLGLLLFAALPWLPALIKSAKLPGGLEFEFREVKREQELQRAEIEALKFLIRNFVTDYELVHLRKLAEGDPFPFQRSDSTNFFVQELRRLADLGLIQRIPGKGIRTLQNQGGDVKDHFEITPVGKDYLRMRGPEQANAH